MMNTNKPYKSNILINRIRTNHLGKYYVLLIIKQLISHI